MPTALSKEETAILIRAKRIQKERNVPNNASVSSICDIAGIARKTGYKWDVDLQRKLSDVLTVPSEVELEHEKLKTAMEQLKLENEGLHLAWEIHDVENILAEKKGITNVKRRKRR